VARAVAEAMDTAVVPVPVEEVEMVMT